MRICEFTQEQILLVKEKIEQTLHQIGLRVKWRKSGICALQPARMSAVIVSTFLRRF